MLKTNPNAGTGKRQYRDIHVWPNRRFFIPRPPEGEYRTKYVTVLDNPPPDEAEKIALVLLGWPQGPESWWEYTLWQGKGKRPKYCLDPGQFVITPATRMLYYFKFQQWEKIFKAMQEDPSVWDDLVTADVVDQETAKEVFGDRHWFRELLEIPLDRALKNPIRYTKTTNDEGKEVTKYRAVKRSFFTVMDETGYTNRNGERIQNQLQVLALSSRALKKFEMACLNDDPEDTTVRELALSRLCVTRSDNDQSESTGDRVDFKGQVGHGHIESKNPAAVVHISPDTIRDRLAADNQFRHYLLQAFYGLELSLDDAVDQMVDAISSETVSKTCDYYLEMLPVMPSQLVKMAEGNEEKKADKKAPKTKKEETTSTDDFTYDDEDIPF